jgi:hypothetical protein
VKDDIKFVTAMMATVFSAVFTAVAVFGVSYVLTFAFTSKPWHWTPLWAGILSIAITVPTMFLLAAITAVTVLHLFDEWL